jgi:NAD+ kinase
MVRRVLLLKKVTLFERYAASGREGRLSRLVEARDPLVARVSSSHDETVRARLAVRDALRAAGLAVTESSRFRRVPDGRFDLVVVAGGDGTVLGAARGIGATPVLAVNSSPSSSVGHYCCATERTFEAVLGQVLAGDLAPAGLTRIRVTVDGVPLPAPALNDCLFAQEVPAATTRYVLECAGGVEEQKSSGVWIATAAGSSGALRSAGGCTMDALDPRLQWLVREPFYHFGTGESCRLVNGFAGTEGMTLVSRMVRAGIYLDGRHADAVAGYSSRVTITPDAPPLHLYLPAWKRGVGGPGRACVPSRMGGTDGP